jgi:DNA-binding IclR family transcriptional regulator
VRRALRILDLLAQSDHGLRLTDIAESLGLPKSSTSLVLGAMVELGWVERDPQTQSYLLGIRAWQAGQAYVRARSLVERAQPVMDRVRDRLKETVRLAVLDGHENVYIGISEGGQALALDTRIGTRLPAHATGLGKALLAGLPPDEVRRRFEGFEFVAYTRNTITGIDQLLETLDQVRRQGWAEDHEEYVLGVRCVAVPIRDHHGDVVAAMSVSVPTIRFNRAHRRMALAELLAAGAEVSARMGAPTAADEETAGR